MNTIKGSLITLILLLAHSAGATPSVDLFGHKFSRDKQKPIKEQPMCENFSGDYKGTCDDQPGQVIQMQLQQLGCDDLIVDGNIISIGAVSMNNQTSKFFTQALSHSLQWITNNALAYNFLGHWSYSFEGETYISPLAVTGQMTLNGNELVYKGNNYTCTYYR